MICKRYTGYTALFPFKRSNLEIKLLVMWYRHRIQLNRDIFVCHEQNQKIRTSHHGAAAVAAPFTVSSERSSPYFLMEIIFVHSDIYAEARRGGVETEALRFISRAQSVFCLASWCAAWTCRLQGRSWATQPPSAMTTGSQQASAVPMTSPLPLH